MNNVTVWHDVECIVHVCMTYRGAMYRQFCQSAHATEGSKILSSYHRKADLWSQGQDFMSYYIFLNNYHLNYLWEITLSINRDIPNHIILSNLSNHNTSSIISSKEIVPFNRMFMVWSWYRTTSRTKFSWSKFNNNAESTFYFSQNLCLLVNKQIDGKTCLEYETSTAIQIITISVYFSVGFDCF